VLRRENPSPGQELTTTGEGKLEEIDMPFLFLWPMIVYAGMCQVIMSDAQGWSPQPPNPPGS